MSNALSIARKISVTAGAMAFAIAFSGAAATPAQAGSVIAGVKHALDCTNWLITDKAKYTANCTPGHLNIFTSSSTGSVACDWCCEHRYIGGDPA